MDPSDITVPITSTENHTIELGCNAPAPVAVNGGIFMGCSKPRNHQKFDPEDKHEATIIW